MRPGHHPHSAPSRVGAAVPAGFRTGLGDRVHPELETSGVRIAATPPSWREVSQGTASGVPIRHWVPRTGTGRAVTTLALSRKQLAWLTARLGRYPFAEYGVLATPSVGSWRRRPSPR